MIKYLENIGNLPLLGKPTHMPLKHREKNVEMPLSALEIMASVLQSIQ